MTLFFKKKLFLPMLLIIALVVTGCGNEKISGEDSTHNLKMSVTVSESSTWYEAAKKFSEDIEKETDGRIKIQLYTNEQLSGGDSGKAVEGLAKGSIDLTFNSTIIYSILDPRFGVISAPFLFQTNAQADAALGGKGGEMLKDVLAEKGVHALGFGESGFRQITNSKRPIQSPEDLEGLKIRIPGITMYTDLFRELGTDPATMTFSEVFTALQQGTIDGQENPIDVISSSKLQEVQKYLTLWNYSYDPIVLGVNKKLYDSLSEADQELFDRLGKEATEYQVKISREKEAEQIEALKASGMEVYTPTADEITAFQEKVKPIYDKYTDIWGEDLLKAFQN